MNIFLDSLEATYERGLGWKTWALRAWSAYNGVSQPNQITRYGKDRAASPDGARVPDAVVPRGFSVEALVQRYAPRPNPDVPPWPVDDDDGAVPESFFAGGAAEHEADTIEEMDDIGDDGDEDFTLTAAVDQPRPVPPGNPIAFAASRTPKEQRHWPVKTRRPERTTVSYETTGGRIVGKGDRRFLAKRTADPSRPQKRHHCGIDLFAYVGDEVVACEDGQIVAFYPFYPAKTKQMTYALLVEFADFVVNLGEVRGRFTEYRALARGRPRQGRSGHRPDGSRYRPTALRDLSPGNNPQPELADRQTGSRPASQSNTVPA